MEITEEHRLYAALRSLRTDEEAAAFLGDLCTPREIDAVSYTHLDVYKRQE